MNISKKNHELDRQNEKNAKKSQKQDVNFQKNSTMYFQIGLILCLLATYFFMEMKFLTPEPFNLNDGGKVEIAKVFNMPDYKIYKEPIKKAKPKVERKKVVLTNNITKVKNDFKFIEPQKQIITSQQNTTDKPVNPVVYKKPVKESININFVEQVPIYPGCEGLSTNKESKLCMSLKISKLVQRKFNTSLGEELGLTGKQKIDVEFKIDQYGNVSGIRSRASHSKLENEAKRVVSKIPQMKPGQQQGKNVSVMYNLPITFQVFN